MMNNFRWLIRHFVLAFALFVVVSAGACWLIGPPPKILAKISGESVFIESKTIDLGNLKSATASFPTKIEPHSQTRLDFGFHAPETPGTFAEVIEIDSDAKPTRMICRVVGRVESKSVDAVSSH